MRHEDLVLTALAALPRWHVVHWATPGTSTLLCLWVAGRETLVPVDQAHVTYDGVRRQVQNGELIRLLRDVQHQQDAAVLATAAAMTAQDRLIDVWSRAAAGGESGVWAFPRGGHVRWSYDGRLRLEASEGGGFTHPMPEPLRDVLVDLGWNGPDLTMRSCWLQPGPDELARAAAISVLTPLAAFGYDAPPEV